MTGETHREGGMLVSVVGFMLLRKAGLLLPDVNEAVQLMVMYPFALWGSTASDLDHHWDSAPSKDGFSWGINKVLHLTTKTRDVMGSMGGGKTLGYHLLGIFDAKHRSWQTHSDLTLASILLILWALLSGRLNIGFSAIDTSIAALILMGICIGVVAHFILDMLTPQGIWCTVGVGVNKVLSKLFKKDMHLLPEKLRFVPHWKMFATGSTWENLICKILRILKVVSVVYICISMFSPDLLDTIFPYEIKFNA